MDLSAISQRVGALDAGELRASLDQDGYAVTPPLLDDAEARRVASYYEERALFRSRVVMSRYAFGSGEYQYFGYPLPEPVATLRLTLYAKLAPIANAWSQRLSLNGHYPADHGAFIELCRANGQVRPTPLLLRYVGGDFNRLHQDLYGPLVFPLQTVIVLDQVGTDFTGGEFVLVEQQPRKQSIARVVTVGRGQAIIFTCAFRPVKSARGFARAAVRHGLSRVHWGTRRALGVIFHDAP